jgi:hypothetical protein
MPESTHTLAGSMQLRVAGISLGILGVLPGPDGPTVRLGAYNPDLGSPEQHFLRVGDEISVAGRAVGVDEIVHGTPSSVRLRVRWTDELADS